MQREKVIIIGSGPAGFTAALYTARAELNPLVLTGDVLGGQVSWTHEVENYPGFPEGIGGAEMVQAFKTQAERFGARVEIDHVSEVDFEGGSPFTVKTRKGTEYLADTVILAVGASPRKLGIPGEEEYVGSGVSYCATCDGFFFRGKDIVVVGGGDSALEEGTFLTRYADSVRIIHRRDELRAGAIMQERARKNEKVSFVWNTVVEEIIGGPPVKQVKVRNVVTDEVELLEADGVFIFIGHDPNNDFLQGKIEMDEDGYVITDDKMMTNIPGVFAAGEIQDPVYRQVATSVGQGTAAAMAANWWLEEHADTLEHQTSEAAAD